MSAFTAHLNNDLKASIEGDVPFEIAQDVYRLGKAFPEDTPVTNTQFGLFGYNYIRLAWQFRSSDNTEGSLILLRRKKEFFLPSSKCEWALHELFNDRGVESFQSDDFTSKMAETISTRLELKEPWVMTLS